MLSAIEKFLLATGQGVGKLKGMTIPEAGAAGAKAMGRGAKDAMQTVKAAPKAAALGGAAGLGAGYGMGRATDDDEEAELKALIAAIRARQTA